MSERTAYKAMAKVFAVVLLIVAIGALIGGLFAHNYVSAQLKQEAIAMPTEKSIANLPKESQDKLKPFLGEMMTTGPQAEAFANNYIWEHMKASCKAGVKAGDKTIVIPEDKCSYAGYGDVTTEYKKTLSGDAAAQAKDPGVVALNAARDTNFKGDSLRGMLLTAYAFWTIGTVAIWASVAAFIGAIVLGLLGWVVLKNEPKKAVVVSDNATI